jgi:hypothetical protein
MGKEAERQEHDLRDGLQPICVVAPNSPLVGGDPIFTVEEGPPLVSPSPHEPRGQTTHE